MCLLVYRSERITNNLLIDRGRFRAPQPAHPPTDRSHVYWHKRHPTQLHNLHSCPTLPAPIPKRRRNLLHPSPFRWLPLKGSSRFRSLEVPASVFPPNAEPDENP